MIDLFGLGKNQYPQEPAPPPEPVAAPAAPRGSHKLWAFLLIFDAVFVIVFAGAVVAKIYQYWNTAPSAVAAARRRPIIERVVIKEPVKTAEISAVASTPPPIAAEPPKAPEPSTTAGKVKALRVEFKLHSPKARSIQLVGAFIMRGGRREMTRQDDGTWTVTLYLNPGLYRYFFAVDKKKQLDPENPHSEKGASLLTLP